MIHSSVVASLVLASSSSQCRLTETNRVVVAADHPQNVTYEKCKEATSNLPCDCSIGSPVMIINEAYLYDKGELHGLSIVNYGFSFNVSCLDDRNH